MGMAFQPVILWTDALIFILVISSFILILWTRRQEHWREPWRNVLKRKLGMISLVILLAYATVGLLDSIHFRAKDPNRYNGRYSSQSVLSLLDIIIYPLGFQDETTYSKPFALVSSSKTLVKINERQVSIYPRLVYGGAYLTSATERTRDILLKSVQVLNQTFLAWFVCVAFLMMWQMWKKKMRALPIIKTWMTGRASIAWREMIITFWFVLFVIFFIREFATNYHILGTDKIGKDVLYEAIKSIRTGLVIGTLTTLVMLPFAVFLGDEAGYFGGWVDDLIQYVYTTLSSIPAVLLISAAVLSLQIFIDNHPDYFTSLESRADARLLALCIILGITSWTSLCRLLRAETLKIREMDFVRAAFAMGVTNLKIIMRHILPNVMHIILITVVLDFSGLVLAEAVLSYVGVGVDPTTISWGNMINSARLDLSREPVVWWTLLAAFIFMFTLVLAANLFADAVRDAFDPRLRNVT